MVYELPIPKSPELFENLVSDIANSLYHTTSFCLYGRKGQNQKGIDILSNELEIVIQCKLRTLNLNSRKTKISFINEIISDINSILKSETYPKKIIIATTLQNDTVIQDYLQTLLFTLRDRRILIEFWSWNKISNEIFLFPNILKKYYPFRSGTIELGGFKILNKSVYEKAKGNELLYYYKNIPRINHLPIFDLSFINNSEETILLNSFKCFCTHQAIGRAGFPPTPVGILKVTKKFVIDLKFSGAFGEYECIEMELDDPIFVGPKNPFRIQIQNTKPLVNFYKICFEFKFNSTTIKSPEFFFNGFNTHSGRVVENI